jgi:hypothetical protein
MRGPAYTGQAPEFFPETAHAIAAFLRVRKFTIATCAKVALEFRLKGRIESFGGHVLPLAGTHDDFLRTPSTRRENEYGCGKREGAIY